MTETKVSGATFGLGSQWKAIDWKKVESEVFRLQVRIAKAVMAGKWNKVKSLQWILTHSWHAKLLAVKRVTSNRGARTAGIDGMIWNTPARKMKGTLSLVRRGYRAQPLRRVRIPKKKGKSRPLGIPILKDRAMQALYLLALEPVAESMADPNSYGFRLYRACRDAIEQCFCALAKSNSARWVLDADIKACFDGISHQWLLDNIPIDKKMLAQWLRCGYVEHRTLFSSRAGTPQGGIISPTLANMTLDGLEQVVKDSCCPKKGSKVNFVRYADDFIVTAAGKELLVEKVIPAIKRFLEPRGLELSKEKTRVVNIEEGFDFLGQTIRRYRNKFLIKPSKDSKLNLLGRIRNEIKGCRGHNAEYLIRQLNPKIRGWCHYHRYVQSSSTFNYVENHIWHAVRKWVKRQHPNKNAKWLQSKYYPFKDETFVAKSRKKDGTLGQLALIKAVSITLRRYIKVRGAANPFDPEYRDYFVNRRKWSCSNMLLQRRLLTAFAGTL